MQTAGVGRSDVDAGVEKLGRVALCTQGALYLIVGILAIQVARGGRGADPSQKGAIAAVAHQPLGKFLLVVLIAGLIAYALWRLSLAVRGEPGNDEDGGSVAKRIANVGRAAIYISFTAAAVRIMTNSGSGGSGSGGGDAKQKSTAVVLDWPGGRWIVVAVGLVLVGVGIWNIRKALTRKFLDHLDLNERSESQRRAIEVIGVAGYAARGVVWGLVAWFLIQAGVTHNPNQTQGLDGALRKVAERTYGTVLLAILAVGLFLFGAFRILDGLHRRKSDITYS